MKWCLVCCFINTRTFIRRKRVIESQILEIYYYIHFTNIRIRETIFSHLQWYISSGCTVRLVLSVNSIKYCCRIFPELHFYFRNNAYLLLIYLFCVQFWSVYAGVLLEEKCMERTQPITDSSSPGFEALCEGVFH